MSGLQPLQGVIYHEKQEHGSMLCAQHALNSLLQDEYFSASDLSDIARRLDALERSVNEDSSAGTSSLNMDDTGFFSVQVLENALKVWGLDLPRWRGQEMRPYQDRPHTLLAFILNLNEHWYTLRRFGPASPKLWEDNGEGHWFNLNSFLEQPEWLSKTYLGMFLHQAEMEGYSVFAVTQADSEGPLALSRTEADDIATSIPEPTSGISHQSSETSSHRTDEEAQNFEDEDWELQAALHASLGNTQYTSEASSIEPPPQAPLRSNIPLPSVSGPSSLTGSEVQTPASVPPSLPVTSGQGSDSVDPVMASIERNRALLQQMREEQETAQRELWDEGFGRPTNRDDDDDEMLRRAIAESEAMARERDLRHDMALDVQDHPATDPPLQGTNIDRVYDDEDAELQAALKASLEHVPDGWIAPPHFHGSNVAGPSQQKASEPLAPTANQHSREEGEEPLQDDSSSMDTTEDDSGPTETVTVEEMRRKRLARFGV